MGRQRITVNIWCDREAEAAGEFYAAVLPATTTQVSSRYPDAGLPDFQADFAGEALTVDVTVDGQRLVLINAGDEFRPNPTVSPALLFDTARDPDARQRLDAVWRRLVDGGEILLPLGDYPFSPHYGWVRDRYGVGWHLITTERSGVRQPMLSPALMFCGAAQNRAEAAVEFYTGLLPASQISSVLRYPEDVGPAKAGTVMFADFTLARQRFIAMDSVAERDYGFDPGMSLQIDCADQAEIDRLWQALSAVPESEQCGWCIDEFGLSWQVVPAAMEELIDSPGAYEAMLEMTKIEIAALRAAG